MTTPTILKDTGRGCLRSAVIQVIAVVVGLPLSLCLLGAALWSVNAFYDRPWIIALITGFLCLVILAIPIIAIGGSAWLRRREMDSLFVPLGLKGSTYSTTFTQHHGQRAGRQVDVYFRRGPYLQIEVSTTLRTRLGLTDARQSDTRWLAGKLGQTPQEAGGFLFFAPDETWARNLVTNPAAAACLGRLINANTLFTRHQVHLRPGAFQLILSGSTRMLSFDLEPAQAQAWVDDLLALAEIAERMPVPQIMADLSDSERLELRMRRANKHLALWVALGTLAVLSLAACAAFGLILLLQSS